MVVLLVLAFAPWRMSITAPAIIESALQAPIHLPEPAQVTAIYVTKDQEVRKGDRFDGYQPLPQSPIELAEREMRLLELEVRRNSVSAENLRDKLVSEQQLAEAQSRLSGLLKRRGELELVAPSSGIVQFSRHIAPGHWVEPEQQLLFVFEPRFSHVVSFVEEARMHRVQNGAEAHFVADDGIYDGVKRAYHD